MGFEDVPYDYVQPPIVAGNEPFGGLKLMSSEPVGDVRGLLEDHYWKYSFA